MEFYTTIMYKIVPKNSDLKFCYIGQTKNIHKRKQEHKHSCNNELSLKYNFHVYKTIRENGGWENWTMEKIEDYIHEDFICGLKREQELIDEYNGNLNKRCTYLTEEDKILYKKRYYKNNMEKIKNYQKEYYKKKTICKEVVAILNSINGFWLIFVCCLIRFYYLKT
jgi:hypothetical protein